MPRVSVIIPTYQRAHVIGEALASVQAQTFTDYEIVVVDDGSSDGTAELMHTHYPTVRFAQQANAGPGAARNLAVELATGELVAFLDSDDHWAPTKLAKQVALFDANPDLGWAYCDMDYFGRPDTDRAPSTFRSIPPVRGWMMKHMLIHSCPMRTSTTMMKRNLFYQAGGFAPTQRVVEDQDLFFRCAEYAPADYVDEILVHMRRGHDRPQGKRYPSQHHWLYVQPRKRALDQHPEIVRELTLSELQRGYTVHLYEAIISAAQERNAPMIQQCLAEIARWEPQSLKRMYYAIARWSPGLFLAIHRPRGHV